MESHVRVKVCPIKAMKLSSKWSKETQENQRHELEIVPAPTKIGDHGAKEERRTKGSLKCKTKQGLEIKCIPTMVNKEGRLETKSNKEVSEVEGIMRKT